MEALNREALSEDDSLTVPRPRGAADPAKVEEFATRALNDASAALTVLLGYFGDRLGIFRDLYLLGPSTAEELADQTRLNLRYVREWLSAMAAAGYLTYDPLTARFELPAEHAPTLCEENGPFFLGGAFHMVPSLAAQTSLLERAFREGGGVPLGAYSQDFWHALTRFTSVWFENHLVQTAVPLMPEVMEKLRRGCSWADLGTGRGEALLKLASAFPKSNFTGFDLSAANVAEASSAAESAGLSSRVYFQQLDVSLGLPGEYDVISTFDVIHDAADPMGIMKAIRAALRPDGVWVCFDINCAEQLEGNIGPVGALFYGVSIFYCMTTSLAAGGAGLGTMGLTESKLQEMARQAGFSSVRTLPLDDPFNRLYEVRP